ncbi:MAG: hypothetical protein U1G07_21230 [Verrucomicrobiota bacterium]
MKRTSHLRPAALAVLATLWLTVAVAEPDQSQPLREGETARAGDRSVLVKKLGTLPFVESEYSRRFKFDTFANPKLKELRSRYQLDEVVASGRSEFERQGLLLEWVHRQFRKFGRPSVTTHGALDILKGIADGNTFFCAQYAELLVSAAASLGWVDRPLALRRHQGVAEVGGSTEHSVTEIWSNQYGKWIMLDPTLNLFIQKDGLPLNAYEIRQEWFYRGGSNLVFVIGKEQQHYRKADLPVKLEHFQDFGDLALYPDELHKYGFIGYIPNTDLMDAGFDYAHMFIVKDQLCEGTRWHTRPLPANPAVDPYFPIGQATLSLRPSPQGIAVSFNTLTPNFDRYEARLDHAGWKTVPGVFVWPLHPGRNVLEARTVNQFSISGPVSLAELEVGAGENPAVR